MGSHRAPARVLAIGSVAGLLPLPLALCDSHVQDPAAETVAHRCFLSAIESRLPCCDSARCVASQCQAWTSQGNLADESVTSVRRVLKTSVQRVEVRETTETLHYTFPLEALALPTPLCAEVTPGTVHYKGEHIRAASCDLLMPAARQTLLSTHAGSIKMPPWGCSPLVQPVCQETGALLALQLRQRLHHADHSSRGVTASRQDESQGKLLAQQSSARHPNPERRPCLP
jgi:hypothetical protein